MHEPIKLALGASRAPWDATPPRRDRNSIDHSRLPESPTCARLFSTPAADRADVGYRAFGHARCRAEQPEFRVLDAGERHRANGARPSGIGGGAGQVQRRRGDGTADPASGRRLSGKSGSHCVGRLPLSGCRAGRPTRHDRASRRAAGFIEHRPGVQRRVQRTHAVGTTLRQLGRRRRVAAAPAASLRPPNRAGP